MVASLNAGMNTVPNLVAGPQYSKTAILVSDPLAPSLTQIKSLDPSLTQIKSLDPARIKPIIQEEGSEEVSDNEESNSEQIFEMDSSSTEDEEGINSESGEEENDLHQSWMSGESEYFEAEEENDLNQSWMSGGSEYFEAEDEEELVPPSNQSYFSSFLKKTTGLTTGLFNNTLNLLPNSASIAKTANHFVQYKLNHYYQQMNTSDQLAALKQEMLEASKDPQLSHFFEWVSLALTPSLTKILTSNDLIKANKDLINDIIQVNIARGFVNLAKHIQKEGELFLPKCSSLAKIVHLISHSQPDFSLKQLEEIEKKYQQDRNSFEKAVKILYPQKIFPLEPAFKSKFMKEYPKLISELKQDLEVTIEKKKKLEEALILLNDCMSHMDARKVELEKIFEGIAFNLLKFILPNGVDGLELPPILKYPGIKHVLYSRINGALSIWLRETYEQLENDQNHQTKWIDNLKATTGLTHLKPIIEAPTTAVLELVKKNICTNLSVVDWVTKKLCQPTQVNNNSNNDRYLLNDLNAKKPLAHWILNSVQQLLNSKSSHLQGTGQFLDQMISNNILAFLAYGSQKLSEKLDKTDQGIHSDEFVKQILDYWIENLQSGDQKFWEDFAQQIPLLSIFKKPVVAKILEVTKGQREIFKIKEIISKLDETSCAQLRKHEHGEQFISITDKIGKQIVEHILEKESDFIPNLDLRKNMQEFLEQFLPSIANDKQIKEWFYKNIRSLGVSKEEVWSDPIYLLHTTINAILRKTLSDTINATKKDKKKFYVSELLQQILSGFRTSFEITSQMQENINHPFKTDLTNALAIQNDLNH